jgi:hypothetical protein
MTATGAKPANLQRPTAEQAAKMMNVSVRTVYDAARLQRTGRDDLIARANAGELTIHRALVLAGVKREPSRLDRMKTAWNGVSDDDRAAFLDWIIERREVR